MNSQITALQWLDDRRFLVGCGPTLSLYDARSSQSSPVWSLDAFDHERIHGIRMNSYTSMNDSRSFLVFGAKSLRLGKIHGDQCEFTSQEIHLNDWIIDVLFLEDHANVSKPTLAALYAHNMVTILDTLSFQSLQTVKCNDLCVLYSGHLSGSTPHNLTITSGTAFREIIIWKFSQGGYIAKKLMGHGGPVHGVKFISNGREIVSCSEDRTLRRWDIASGTSLTIYVGHLSRIWDFQAFDTFLVSVGEDASCRVWSLEDGTCLTNWEGHEGKHTWRVGVNPSGSLIASGGGDGGIRLWSLASLLKSRFDEDDTQTISINERSKPIGASSSRPEIAKQITVLDAVSVCLLTSHGRFILHNSQTSTQRTIYTNPDFGKLSFMKASQNGSLIVAGNHQGTLVILSALNAFKPLLIHAFNGQLFNLSIDECVQDSEMYVVSVMNKDRRRIAMHRVCPQLPDPVILICHIDSTSKSPCTHITYSSLHQIALLSSGNGSVLVFDTSEISDSHLNPVLILDGVHGKEGTSSCYIDYSNNDSQRMEFLSCGKDGRLCRFLLHKSTNEWKCENVDAMTCTSGSLESIVNDDGKLYITGFFNKRFFLLDFQTRVEVMSVACGGGKRSWDVRVFSDQRLFGFIRMETFQMAFLDDAVTGGSRLLKDPFQGSEVRAIHSLDFSGTALETRLGVFVSGGETTLLKFHTYDFESKTLTTLPIRRKAPATIRSICSHRLSETEYLVITAGGQQSIPAWKVSLATDDEGQVLLTCSDIGPRRTLLKSETDCRIMAIACLPVDGHQKGLFHVFTANSDAYLRVLEFNIQTGAFQLLAQSDAQDCCLQCLRVVRLEDKDWIITGGTSGRISLWTFESLLTLKQDFAIHQSGINSLDAQMNKESGELAVVSGGDDNLVSWLSLCMNHKEDEWMETGRVSISTAHASTITGVSLLNFETFASVSIDQRVHLWQVSRSMTGSTQNARLELLQSRYTHIADVQCMDVLQRHGNALVLSGTGAQVLELSP